MNVATFANFYVWLWDVQHGVSIAEVAQREGLSRRRVRQGIAWARGLSSASGTGDTGTPEKLRPPRLVPLFPIGAFTPLSECERHRWITRGSVFCCMICHRTGVDDHPALQRNWLTDPKPEPPPPAPPKPEPARPETRKERRRRLYGEPYTKVTNE